MRINFLLGFVILITHALAIANNSPLKDKKDNLSQTPSHQKTIDEWNSLERKQAQLAAKRLHKVACSINPYSNKDPWHISNLYNCANKELFIPYQLWTGAVWNGDKNANCMQPTQEVY